MKISFTALFFWLFLISNPVLAISRSIPDSLINQHIIAPYLRFNAVPGEQVYIHFNKSSYLPGDHLWFTAYIINPSTGLTNNLTANLYTELYDPGGKLLEQKILFVKSGISFNDFCLSATALPGSYTFRTYTNWMKNFNTVGDFDLQLEVLGKEMLTDTVVRKLSYDVQFFAESGTFLQEVANKISVKAVDSNGCEVSLAGRIIESQTGDTIPFQLNAKGMGELFLTPSKLSSYKALVDLPDGKTQEFIFPLVEKKGVVVSANTFLKQKFILQIRSNAETIGNGRFFYVLVHKDGQVLHSVPVELTPQKPEISFSFDKETTASGVNYVTVFDTNYQPVAERLFFNKSTNIHGKISIEKVLHHDSIQFDISTFDAKGKPVSANLSLSVLPGGTISNKFKNSLLSDMLLKSGVRGQIHNPQYYFENEDFERLKSLDFLLLTQGWRKYDWKEIFAQKEERANDFEVGFTISGSAITSRKGGEDIPERVSLFSPDNKLYLVLDTDSSGRFTFPDLFLSDSSRVILSSWNIQGKNHGRKLTAKIIPNYKPDSLIGVKPHLFGPETTQTNQEVSMDLMKGVIRLKEISITSKRKKAPFEGDIYATPMIRTFELTKENYWKYTGIEQILRSEFNVNVYHEPGSGDYVIDMGRGSTGFAGFSGKITDSVAIIIDGMRVLDNSMLFNYTVEEIEAIAVNKLENSLIDDANSSIIVKTRTKPIDWGYVQPSYIQKFRVRGYSKAQRYYTPEYQVSEESPVYQKYGTVFWAPDVVTDASGRASLRFQFPAQLKGFDVRIEGISTLGNIYLFERNILIDN
jgi:hypothetical protein